MASQTEEYVPGAGLDMARMPGHWLLARMGKRVLRPGGLELTRRMLDALALNARDHVVEFAPGLGVTARMALQARPASYLGIEREEAAAARVRTFLDYPNYRCLVGSAEETGLEEASATVVYGEAMLTMYTPGQKARIVREAYRILKPGGRYGIHELGLTPDSLDEAVKEAVLRDLSAAIHVGARPLTASEWRAVLEAEGFQVRETFTAPMHLLEPGRLIQDEGLGRALRIVFNILRTPPARKRVLAMRRVFRTHQAHLTAIALIAVKPVIESADRHA
ncbi:MAG: class I SAM-dependent methyltransferase [Oscillochloridaceae bacterium]|nr:class I SAM-dependent methyltransferase [Chloroflexaceae bacterium]MDW8389659.1 class I SAM-dependent methyltransferase [Oscillochloridaceae bacterium]